MTENLKIIAEAGVNHNGDLATAKNLAKAAMEAGADVVKFQTFSADRLATKSAAKANYQLKTSEKYETQHEMLKRLELSHEEFQELRVYCDRIGIEFLTSAFDAFNLNEIMKFDLKQIKVPSGEITNLPYLKRVGQLGLPVILSTGMCYLGEIEQALLVLYGEGIEPKDVTLLHCNSEYPTPLEDVNLRAMRTIGKAFDVRFGYSDHTMGSEVSIAAVAMGACIIEKHLTLNSNSIGPDHKSSLEPKEFSKMVKSLRDVSLALGSSVKKPSASEESNRDLVRKSIVASTKIERGEEFSYFNLTTKRPANGISPMRLNDLIGKKSARTYVADEIIEI